MKRKFEELKKPAESAIPVLDHTRQVNLISQNKHISLPDSPFTAKILCPSLVILSVCLDDKTETKVSDVGFIIDSGDEVTTVWGQAWFLYDYKALKENKKILRCGKIMVTLQCLESHGKSYEGTLKVVDCLLNLVVVEIQTPDGKRLKKATPAISSPNLLDSHVFLDLHACRERFFPETYTFRISPDDGCESCGKYLHVDLKSKSVPGVLLNCQLQIMGMKTRRCDINNQLDHVLLMDDIYRSLRPHTQWSEVTIISGNDIVDSNRSSLVPQTLMAIKRHILCVAESQKEKKWEYIVFWEASPDTISNACLTWGGGEFIGEEETHMAAKFYRTSFESHPLDLPYTSYRSGNMIWLNSPGYFESSVDLLWLSETRHDSEKLSCDFQFYTSERFKDACKHGFKTLVYVPTSCGVVELAASEFYTEDWKLVRNIKSLFGKDLEAILV